MDLKSLVGTQIGNYLITDLLGQGGMGTVYLAEHPDIGRRVAIKVLAPQFCANPRIAQRFLSEAKAVVRISHPNIIDIFDFGRMSDGRLYYVMEMLRGRELLSVINERGKFSAADACPYVTQICAAIQAAHEQDVVHRDLKPENIFVLDRQPLLLKVLDFGIAKLLEADEQSAASVTHTGVVLGTPLYISPEQAAGNIESIGPASDIYSLGVIIFLMLSGRTPFTEKSVGLLLSKHINDVPPRLDSIVPGIPAAIAQLIANCLAKEPKDRPATAAEIAQIFSSAGSAPRVATPAPAASEPNHPGLESTAVNENGEHITAPAKGGQVAEGPAPDKHLTLDFLMQRMKHREDFPAISQYISDINRMAILSHTTSASQMANTILKDFSLTSKLLKLVNSAFYGRYAGSITTISRAVVILGFEQVRMAATSLTLFDHLQNKSQADDLKDASISAFMGGMMAKEMAPRIGIADAEEAFLCSMFHNLGRQLVIYYFIDEHKKILQVMEKKGCPENQAVREVLGISYQELGSHVGRLWKFPEKVISCMRKLPAGEIDKPNTPDELLRNLSNFSNELCELVNSTDPAKKETAIAELSARYKNNFEVEEKQMSALLQSVLSKAERYSSILNIDTASSNFIKRMQSWQASGEVLENEPTSQQELEPLVSSEELSAFADEEKSTPVYAPPDKKANTGVVAITQQEKETSRLIEVADLLIGASEQENRQNVLIHGIQEITNTLLGDASLDDILTMILETMYRGFDFDHVLVAIISTDRKTANARFGLGDNIEQFLKSFRFPITPASKDIFNQALANAKDMIIDNADAPEHRPTIPDWYRQAIGSRSFLIYPVTVFMRSIGLFYADRRETGAPIIPEHTKFMQTLRNQAVLAIKQKYAK